MKRRWVVSGVLLLIVFIAGSVWYSQEPLVPFLVEAAVPQTPYKLRLLRISEEPFEYAWNTPPAAKFMGYFASPPNEYRMRDINLHFRGVTFFDRFPAKGFLFRFVDEEGRWAFPQLGLGWYRFVESTGWIYRARNGNLETGSGAQLESFSQFPRRERTLHIEWKSFSSITPTPPIRFEIPNPYFREEFPVWKPRPLPQTQTHGEVTVELKSMRPWPLGSDLNYEVRSTTGNWHAGSGFSHDSKYVFMQDATGNTGEVLSPFEPAWKIVIRPFRHHLAEHPPEQIHSIGTFPLPAPGAVIPVDRDIMIGKSRIRLNYVAGAGTVTSRNGKYTGMKNLTTLPEGYKAYASKGVGWASQPQPFVLVSFGEIPADREVFVRCQVADDLPSDTELENRIWSDIRVVIPLPIPARTAKQEIELSIVENTCEQFEFIVEPPEEMREKVRNGDYDKYWKWLQ